MTSSSDANAFAVFDDWHVVHAWFALLAALRRHLEQDEQQRVMLPQIVVVGNQTSGKSSTLASVSGLSMFTKKGMGTRVPLRITLEKANGSDPEPETRSDQHQSYPAINGSAFPPVQHAFKATLKYRTNEGAWQCKRTNDRSALSELVKTAQNEIVGVGDTGVSEEEAILQVEDPMVPTIEFVDLPGFRLIDTTSNTPANRAHGDDIKRLAKKYVCTTNSIVLLVIKRDDDYDNCAPFDYISTWEREEGLRSGDIFKRTVIVVTRSDDVGDGLERGQQFYEQLDNLRKKLKPLAVIPVANKEIFDAGAPLGSLAAVREYEAEEFIKRGHQEVDRLGIRHRGVRDLISVLSSILVGKLRDVVGSLQDELRGRIREAEQELVLLEPGKAQQTVNKKLKSALDAIQHVTVGVFKGDPFKAGYAEKPPMRAIAGHIQKTVFEHLSLHKLQLFSEEVVERYFQFMRSAVGVNVLVPRAHPHIELNFIDWLFNDKLKVKGAYTRVTDLVFDEVHTFALCAFQEYLKGLNEDFQKTVTEKVEEVIKKQKQKLDLFLAQLCDMEGSVHDVQNLFLAEAEDTLAEWEKSVTRPQDHRQLDLFDKVTGDELSSAWGMFESKYHEVILGEHNTERTDEAFIKESRRHYLQVAAYVRAALVTHRRTVERAIRWFLVDEMKEELSHPVLSVLGSKRFVDYVAILCTAEQEARRKHLEQSKQRWDMALRSVQHHHLL